VTFDFVGHRLKFYLLSLAVILPGLISLILPGGLRPGIDFTSGTIMTLRFDAPVEQGALREAFGDLDHPEAIVQRSDDGTFVVRTFPFEQAISEDADQQRQTERQRVVAGLTDRFGPVEVLSLDSVSPIVATETVLYSGLAVLATSVGILLYLWWAFRRVPHPIRYGACAVVALLQVALLLVGVFSILGRLFNVEVDALFITAVLTVIGFAVHDTITVFDRIRENFLRHAGESFADVVNHSLTQTLARSLSTGMTVILTLVALYLFGGVTIRNFVLALLIGIVAGTYSSIFNASMLLYSWEHGEIPFLGRRSPAQTGRGQSPPLRHDDSLLKGRPLQQWVALVLEGQALDQLLDVLDPVARTDQDHVRRLDDDDVLQTDRRDPSRGGKDQAIARPEPEVLAVHHVAGVVARQDLHQLAPAPDVAPRKTGWNDGDAV
jgi:preprotein translocase subunit SecF